MAGASAGGFASLVRGRRMTRSFSSAPVEGELIDRLIDLARRAPAAGNTAGLRFLVLDEPGATERYWDTSLPPERRPNFPWPGLLHAPVLVLPCVAASAYVARYGEADKARRVAASPAARRALASDPAGWTVPYWFVDGGMAVMTLLLGAADAGLGALLFGLFEQEEAIKAAFGIPPAWQPLGAVALGWPSPAGDDRRSRSAARARPPLNAVRFRGGWPEGPESPGDDPPGW